MSGTSIFADWGTTRLRAWSLLAGQVTGRVEGPGIGALTSSLECAFTDTIARLPGGESAESATICGMIGARDGLREVPYAKCPVSAQAWRNSATTHVVSGVHVRIGAGVCCRDEDGRSDVMRGEETQIFGALSLYPALATGRHIIVLPGTHSKWVVVEDGRITAIRTFLTGEIFGLLGASSLFAMDAADLADDDGMGLTAGLEARLASDALLANLFQARVGQLVDGRSAGWAKGFVSGLLIGSELVEAARDNDHSGEITFIGDSNLVARYLEACESLAQRSAALDATACTLEGLRLLDADN